MHECMFSAAHLHLKIEKSEYAIYAFKELKDTDRAKM